MQIPFVDTVLARTGLRRPEEPVDDADTGQDFALPLDQEVVEDEVDTSDDTLLLQKMENRLVRHHLANPDVLAAEDLRRLRYLLNFARLADFEPGAAGPGGSRGRGDVSVGGELTPWRTRVADTLRGRCANNRTPSRR